MRENIWLTKALYLSSSSPMIKHWTREARQLDCKESYFKSTLISGE